MWRIVCVGLFFSGLLFNSCKSDDFRIGRNLVDPHVRIIRTDTITVRLSNFAIDSMVTSGNREGWHGFAGYYDDPAIGKLSAQSYIEINRTQNSESNKYAYFDSVMLVFRPNGNYYGDSTQNASFKISRLKSCLKDEFEMRDEKMYSTSFVPVGAPLTKTAEVSFRMRPNRKAEEIEIRLLDSFGDSLFRGIRDNLDYMRPDINPKTQVSYYLETFPGISISTGSNSSCVYGFGVNDTSCLIRVYYSVSATIKEQKKMEFKPNPHRTFFCYESEKLPDLADIDSKKEPKPTSGTRNMGVLMSGTPMYTRIQFPYLNNIFHMAEIVMIREATLFIKPVYNSYDTVPLPPKLNLYYYNPLNYYVKGSALSERSGYGQQTLTGNLPANYRIQRYPHYSFNITDFISDQLGKFGNNSIDLFVAIPNDSENSTIQRLLFGDQKFIHPGNIPDFENQVQLRIDYITYND